jgi:uncharacterized membrane protein YozB (DUF420 family)
MEPSVISGVILVSEIAVATAIFYVIYHGFKYNRFFSKLILAAVTYEILINVGYMIYRTIRKTAIAEHGSFYTGFAIFHGILSLVMLIFLIVFIWLAARAYGKGINFFKDNFHWTFVFFAGWTLSLLTGVLVYFWTYFY